MDSGKEETEKTVEVRAIQPTFRPADYRPPFLLRLGSVFIDYIILLIIPLSGLLSERLLGGDGLGIFSGRTLWLFGVMLAGINCVVLPILAGQTVGKMLTGIRIVHNDGTMVSIQAMLLRQTLGYVITLATFGLGFFLAAVNQSGRTLHDFIFGTVVVRARKLLVPA
jgi:uncharacterized RDD family membrane protein YckC